MADDKGRGRDVPQSMREVAEQSVSQARRALEEYMSAAQRAMTAVEGTTQAAQAGMRDASRKAVEYAETNVGATFDFAERLVRAQDMREIVALQQEFLRTQMERFGAQMRELGDLAARTASDATQRAGVAAGKPKR